MPLQSFRASTVADAMERVRQHFGEDAIIVATRHDPQTGEARVIVAVKEAQKLASQNDQVCSADAIDAIGHSLERHAVPAALADRLLSITASSLSAEDPVAALAVAIDAAIGFAPLSMDEDRVMLAGSPGMGKTVTLAKLAVSAKFRGRPICVISCDDLRAGGIEQLAVITQILGLPLYRAQAPNELAALIKQRSQEEQILIDTAAINPYIFADMRALQALSEAAETELIPVFASGQDVLELRSHALRFQEIGAKRIILTRLDLSRRIGGLLGAAYETNLKLAQMTASHHVTRMPQPASPINVARILLSEISGTLGVQSLSEERAEDLMGDKAFLGKHK